MLQEITKPDETASGAYILVKALESFVKPLVQVDKVHAPGEIVQNTSLDGISVEALDLLSALKRYVATLVQAASPAVEEEKATEREHSSSPPLPSEKEGQRLGEVAPAEDDGNSVSNANYVDRPVTLTEQDLQFYNERHANIRYIMDQARYNVYNKIPIRLLTFNHDGTGIRLVDRPQVWGVVGPDLEKHLNTLNLFTLLTFNLADMEYTSYAILSHTWLQSAPGEVTFADWTHGTIDKSSAGYRKLERFCKIVATKHRLTLAWMDTVCINKESSTELDESIRSMYKWYQKSRICIVYLADTMSLTDLAEDRWFTRGWTLQELIAPERIQFLCADWEGLVQSNSVWNKQDVVESSLVLAICRAAMITRDELQSPDLSSIPISRRMQWAASRNVTREEDIAYSLMGIFDVNMSIAYGEGEERAFNRLAREILSSHRTNVLDIVNCGFGNDQIDSSEVTHPSNLTSILLPDSPRAYVWAAQAVQWPTLDEPVTLSHLGLCVKLLLVQGVEADLTVTEEREKGSLGISSTIVGPINVQNNLGHWTEDAYYKFWTGNRLCHLKDGSNPIFAVLNFQEIDSRIAFPEGPCFAIIDASGQGLHALESREIRDSYKFQRSITERAITFGPVSENGYPISFPIESLNRYGMALRTYYL